MDSCYICESVKFSKRSGSVRDNKNLNILKCDNCGLVFLDKKSHINDKWSFIDNSLLNKSYADTLASIGKTDTLIAFLKK